MTTLPFGSSSNPPLSFSDLAKKADEDANRSSEQQAQQPIASYSTTATTIQRSSSNVIDVLAEYGPPIAAHRPRPDLVPGHPVHDVSQPIMNPGASYDTNTMLPQIPNYEPTFLSTSDPFLSQASTYAPNEDSWSADKAPGLGGPYHTAENFSNTSNIAISSRPIHEASDTQRESSENYSSDPLYSPPPRNSPPQEDLSGQDDTSIRNHVPGRIPKRSDLPSNRSCNYDEMDLLTLQQKFRELDQQIGLNNNRRQDIERSLNDIVRNSKGKNVEHDPLFKAKKDDQKDCELKLKEYRDKLAKVVKILQEKFNYRMTAKSSNTRGNSRPIQGRQKRAKMSTTDVGSNFDDKDLRLERKLLHFIDGPTMCSNCDEIFDTTDALLEHMHRRKHLNNMKTSTPWRVKKDKLDAKRTYAALKSMLGKVSEELDNDHDFSIKELDQILDPKLKEDGKRWKDLVLARERGKFAGDDRLFGPLGYEHLVPISGFYCSLCDRAYCDIQEAKQHLSGYKHHQSFIKTLAIDPEHEIQHRNKMERLTRRQPSYTESSRYESSQSLPKSPTTSLSASGSSQPAPPVRYKKATSRIVDEHESIANLYPEKSSSQAGAKKRSASVVDVDSEKEDGDSSPVKKAKQSSTLGDDDNEPPNKKISRRVAPEIVPVTRTQPSLLKQLRVKRKAQKEVEKEDEEEENITSRRRSYISDDSDDDDEVEVLQEVHVSQGDPDSPFPELDLQVSGNNHVSLLKDKRLAAPCRVVLTSVNLDDFEDMLLDRATVWSRVSFLIAKRESSNEVASYVNTALKEKTKTSATYFGIDGAALPVDLENSGSESDTGISSKRDVGKREKSKESYSWSAGPKSISHNSKASKRSTSNAPKLGFTMEPKSKKSSTIVISTPGSGSGTKRPTQGDSLIPLGFKQSQPSKRKEKSADDGSVKGTPKKSKQLRRAESDSDSSALGSNRFHGDGSDVDLEKGESKIESALDDFFCD